MDRQTVIGLILIGLIFIGFSWYSGSQQAKRELEKIRIDSINQVQKAKEAEWLAKNEKIQAEQDSMLRISQEERMRNSLGTLLYNAQQGSEETFTLENDKIIVNFTNKGAAISSVVVKDYKTFDDKPLYLFKPENNVFDLTFTTNQNINTSNFYFTPVKTEKAIKVNGQEESMAFRLYTDSLSYVEYLYTLKPDDYIVDFKINFVGMENIMSPIQTDLLLRWENTAPQQEKGYDYENQYTTLAYNHPGSKDIEELAISKGEESEVINTKIKWVAFKQQFFSSIILAENDFSNGEVGYETMKPGSGNMKHFTASLKIPYNIQTDSYDFSFYFGPNSYKILKSYDNEFQKLIPLGWGIFGWINRFIIIPTFDFLGGFMTNYGWIILLLTIFIKLIIFPFTYKSYLSMAKMRLLKPEMDEINAKYPKKEDAMKKQQAMLDLYRRAGVSPMGGCLPLLFQFPILIAMFRFFPASIELRQEHFLWATDLSSYDSILQLPFNIPFYGDHVSLFALLMGVSMYVASKINFAQNSAASSNQLPGMTFMSLYLMPIMLVEWFNNYSSGLSYYYLLSNLITIIQSLAFRHFVSDTKLHQRMKENAKKPRKKSKWQMRYEELMKQQQQQQEMAKKRNRK